MTDQEFIDKIDIILTDVLNGTKDKPQAVQALVELFLSELDPHIKSTGHLQMFIYRVQTMRSLQDRYFKGEKKLFKDSINAERMVDNDIKNLLSDHGYTTDDIKPLAEQKSLF